MIFRKYETSNQNIETILFYEQVWLAALVAYLLQASKAQIQDSDQVLAPGWHPVEHFCQYHVAVTWPTFCHIHRSTGRLMLEEHREHPM